MFDGINLRKFDLKLVIMTLTIAVIGIFAIGSAQESLQTKQMAGVIAGGVAMIVISFFNYSFLLKMNWLMYIANLGLLWQCFFSETILMARRDGLRSVHCAFNLPKLPKFC